MTVHKTTSGDDYPVERIFCVGRNYEAHVREMGKDPNREAPFFFTKWAETLVNAGPEDEAQIVYPSRTENYHHEIELVVAISKDGFKISVDDAQSYIWGYAVGLDMTRRDLQLAAREKGRPWDTGKNVVQSCPVGRLAPVSETGLLVNGEISLTVNDKMVQESDVDMLIWNVNEIISDLSHYYALRAGDIIFTGTPAGVGAILPGDVLKGNVKGLPPLEVTIGPKQ